MVVVWPAKDCFLGEDKTAISKVLIGLYLCGKWKLVLLFWYWASMEFPSDV